MLTYRKIDRHAALVGRMARVRHVDIGEAMAEGRLSAEAYRNAVLRCTRCESPEDCVQWLAEHAGGAGSVPRYCRNGQLFARLQRD